MSTTEDRIENLENQVRRQRRWNIALGAVVVVGGLMVAIGVRSVPDVIRAKKIEVVSDRGRVLVSLSNAQDEGGVDQGAIETRDGAGSVMTEIGSGPWGGVVRILNGGNSQNRRSQALVELGVKMLGREGKVTTRNDKGVDLVLLDANAVGNGVVMTQNGKAEALVVLAATTDGDGTVTTQNGKGQELVILGATAGGNGLVKTENGKGQTLVRLGSTPMGGKVLVNNAIGKGVAAVASNPADGSGVVATFDSAGKVTSMTPGP